MLLRAIFAGEEIERSTSLVSGDGWSATKSGGAMKTWRMAPSEALNCAADIIEQRGWCQHAPTIDGAVCTLAALQIAVTGELKWDFMGFESAPYIDALKQLTSFLGIPLGSVCTWNNNRTKEQVIAALRGASK